MVFSAVERREWIGPVALVKAVYTSQSWMEIPRHLFIVRSGLRPTDL